MKITETVLLFQQIYIDIRPVHVTAVTQNTIPHYCTEVGIYM